MNRPIIFLLLLITSSFQLQAVHLSKDKTGQVLIFPYYTVNGGQDTLINLVNTTDETKALRVRFREAANSREVFAFNVYLGANDVWSGGVINTEDDIPQILSFDQSCTLPEISFSSNTKFYEDKFTGDFSDNYSDYSYRMNEGFIEVFEMGVVTGASAAAAIIEEDTAPDCSVLQNAWNSEGYWTNNPETDMLPPSGGITGNVTIINVTKGLAISQEPTAFENFSDDILNFNIDHDSPSLADGSVNAQIEQDGAIVNTNWPTGYQAISALLMKNQISNEFVLTDVIGANTDWIVTMPTKQYHTDSMYLDGTNPVAPFVGDNNSCEEYRYAYWNRETQEPGTEFDTPLPGVPPPLPPVELTVLCHSANNIAFYDSEYDESQVPFGIFSSNIPGVNNEQEGVRIDTIFTLDPTYFDTGWMSLTFDQSVVHVENNDIITLVGMPVIGFAAQNFVNNSDNQNNRNYAAIFAHKYSNEIIRDEAPNEEKAMQITEDNKGQVLLFPYYTVKNDINTLLSIVNTTNETRALRIRFLEGNNSRNVLSFNIYISPYDVWTAGLVPTTSTTPGYIGEPTVKLVTFDNSCTVPAIINGQEFLPYAFTGEFTDGFGETLDRSQEGSIEIFEMGTLSNANDLASAQHNTSGVPSCTRLTSHWQPPSGKWFQDPNEDINPPTGNLFASVSLIDIARGIDMTYDATAIVNFSTESNHTYVGDLSPNLSTGNNLKTSISTQDGIIRTNWSSAIDAVSALFMQTEVSNNYTIEPTINAQTDWVNYYPTRPFYTDPMLFDIDIGSGPFEYNKENCVILRFESYNRDQQKNGIEPLIVPVLPPGIYDPQHCNGVNTVSINDVDFTQSILGSNLYMLDWIDREGFDSVYSIRNTEGWMKNIYNETSSLIGTGENGETHEIFGLPVLGFAAQRYINNNSAPGVMANYAVIQMNKGKRKITIEE
ncbi:MAG: hypothetical protein AB8B80_15075 [Marinicellaceae bacterium]